MTSAVLLILARIVFAYINLSSNLSSWIFSLIYQVGCLGVVPFLMYRFMIGKDVKELCFDTRISTKLHYSAYVIAFALGFLVFFLNSAVSSLWYVFLQTIGYTYASGAGTIFSSPEVLIFEILCTCMLPAIFEEFMHRGVLLGALDNLKSDRLKIAIVAIFFGLVHQNIAQLIPTMVGGFVMAILAVKGRSILPGAIIHFMNNFLVIMVTYNAQMNNSFDTLYNNFYSFYGSNIIVLVALSVLAVAVTYWLINRYIIVTRKDRVSQEWASPELVLEKTKAKEQNRQQGRFIWQSNQQPREASRDAYSVESKDGEFYDIFNTTGSVEIKEQPPEQKTYEFVVNIGDNNNGIAEEENNFPEPQMPKGIKNKIFDYGYLAITAFLTVGVTVMTFIWGLLR